MRTVYVALVAVVACLLAGCDAGGNAAVEKQLQQMSLQEKVGQMFIVRPEALDPDAYYNSPTDLKSLSLQSVNDRMRETATKYPMGGIILFSNNIKDPVQLMSFVADLKAFPSHPLRFSVATAYASVRSALCKDSYYSLCHTSHLHT